MFLSHHCSRTQHPRPQQWTIVLCVLLAVSGFAGCDKFKSSLKRTDFPDMGPRLANSVKLTMDPALTNLEMPYTNGCNSPLKMPIGAQIQPILIAAVTQNFRTVAVTGERGTSSSPDTEIILSLQHSDLKLLNDHVYDRVPADLTLETLVTFKDATGKEFGQQTVSARWNQRLILEPLGRRCDFGNIEEFLHDAGIALSTEVIRVVRAKFEGPSGPAHSPLASSAINAPSPPVLITSSPTRTGLSFKATVLDENNNLVFEKGERIRVRIDLMNAGDHDLQGITATVTGTAELLAQFPSTSLIVGQLQSGQSRSIEFAATIPQTLQRQTADIHVAISHTGSAPSPSPQVFALAIQSSGVSRDISDDVDHLPARATGFQQPQTYVIAIGIGTYRDPQILSRKFASSDAEIVARYFQSLGGVPAANVRVLQDRKALRADIDEVLLDWLPPLINKDAVVIVYFAGLASVSSTGETFLVPYDGTATTLSRAYALKDLERDLTQLKVKHTLLLFDGNVSRLGVEKQPKSGVPNWNPSGSSTVHMIVPGGVGRGLIDDQHRHGLFTYDLLRALRGDADTNRDGDVTVGETVAYVTHKASKTNLTQAPRPLITPPLRSTDPINALTLTKLAGIQGTETR